MRDPQDALPLTPLTLAVLTALLDGELHGYGIIKAVEEQSEGRLRPGPGSLYAALDRLSASDLIAERQADQGGGAAQRLFALSSYGRAVLRAEYARLERLGAIARARGLDVRRA